MPTVLSLKMNKTDSSLDNNSLVRCPLCSCKLKEKDIELHLQEELAWFEGHAEGMMPKQTDSKSRNAAKRAKEYLMSKPRPEEQVILKIKASRQKRHNKLTTSTKKRKLMDDSERLVLESNQACFMCGKVLPSDLSLVNQHIDTCLSTHCQEPEPIVEYTWAGQTRVRATALYEGDFASSGFSVHRKTDQDTEEDIDIDDDGTETFGAMQYNEQDLQQFALPVEILSDEEDVDVEDPELIQQQHSLLEHNTCNTENDVIQIDVEHDTQQQGLTIHCLKERVKELEASIHSLTSNTLSNLFPKCLICLEPYNKPLVSIGCWHVHCERCWMQSLAHKRVCPQCQVITGPSELRQIFI